MPSIFDDLAKRVQDLPGHLGDTGGAIQERISQFTSSVNYAINPDRRFSFVLALCWRKC